ncbi:hypothetical protein G7B40_037525 [Aetokthonos hydrillicola Thurmond2011]|uniref:Uncharacterized protein n=1 Tax=Aetokthonos hydrillicola Thurmond2011 TaxID=2712845 RepID=A0AAP5IES4_9CYAN|nr:hypothetical protein [Aetokthonos hydrillicola]MBO3461230.1 hypothetical protein [Aetokthonos hydrillicola CCALA 1050]MBW4591041.1 hypothetical protein [Aetokthonos hydrillicola CCALA 1050]MDR9900211.1 hypothetical protein [Aetokthonos hydrillicola Thurmond2011]
MRSHSSSAHTNIQGALAFALASGQSILGAAIDWLNRHHSSLCVLELWA